MGLGSHHPSWVSSPVFQSLCTYSVSASRQPWSSGVSGLGGSSLLHILGLPSHLWDEQEALIRTLVPGNMSLFLLWRFRGAKNFLQAHTVKPLRDSIHKSLALHFLPTSRLGWSPLPQ